jgi:hypothetical protein
LEGGSSANYDFTRNQRYPSLFDEGYGNSRLWSIVLKKSEGIFRSQFPVEPSLADAAMIQDTYRN